MRARFFAALSSDGTRGSRQEELPRPRRAARAAGSGMVARPRHDTCRDTHVLGVNSGENPSSSGRGVLNVTGGRLTLSGYTVRSGGNRRPFRKNPDFSPQIRASTRIIFTSTSIPANWVDGLCAGFVAMPLGPLPGT